MADHPHLGPLPLSDRADELEELSDRALRNAFPTDRFRIRNEPGKDRGADRYIEVKQSGFDTNCRAQLQVKATGSPRTTADGSISLSVEVSNLNYLLNGPSPLYILWVEPTGELRYAWARDEQRRLDADNANWMLQETVVLQFRRLVDAPALEEIHARVLREAQFDRRIHEIVIRVASSESVVISIDSATLECTDPAEMYQRIISGGMGLVSAGFGGTILKWIESISPAARAEATVQLVAGYAHASLSRFHASLGPLADAATKRTDLSETDQQFLDRIRLICDFRVGIVDEPEYTRRYGKLAEAAGGTVLAEHRLQTLRDARLHERDVRRRADLLDSMRRLAAEIQLNSDASAAQKLQTKIVVVSAEGDAIATRIRIGEAHVEMRRAMGYSAAEMERIGTEAATANWDAWEREALSLQAEALALGHPVLLADAIAARLGVILGVLQMRRLQAFSEDRPWTPDVDRVHAIMQEAELACKIYSRAGIVQGECAAKLFLADLFDLVGQRQAARSLADGVLPIADAFNLVQQSENAREYVNGPTTFEAVCSRIRQSRAIDKDMRLAEESDERVRSFARDSWESLQIPENRLAAVERDCFVVRAIARERVDWCRHLQLEQDLKHTISPLTCYREDPNRRCLCEKHGYVSSIEAPDADVIVRAFKETYCAGCKDRSPKNQPNG
jgi:hypothetical protein